MANISVILNTLTKNILYKTGEFFVPDQSEWPEITVNIDRYLFALQFLKDKIVIDAGCGAGLGTYLYSLVANHVYAIDHNKEALEYAKRYPKNISEDYQIDERKVHFLEQDLDKDVLPKGDICVAFEVIEHLEQPDFFLSQLKVDELVFSVPLDSIPASPKFHKQDFRTLDDIKELIERYFKIDDYYLQADRWIYGKGKKI